MASVDGRPKVTGPARILHVVVEGLAVERVVLTAVGVKIVQLVTDDPDAARCPGCVVVSASGKGWVLTRPRDLPCGGEFAQMQWRNRRWRCRTEACDRPTFTEQVAQVPAGMRTTTRLRATLAVAVEDGRDQSEVAGAHGVSWPTVPRAVVARGSVLCRHGPVEGVPVRIRSYQETARRDAASVAHRPPPDPPEADVGDARAHLPVLRRPRSGQRPDVPGRGPPDDCDADDHQRGPRG